MLFAASNRQGSTAETVFSEARSGGIIAGKEGRDYSRKGGEGGEL
jgi:hypothetical protein